MDNLEIFDKEGRALNIADVIYSFIKAKAEIVNAYIGDVYGGPFFLVLNQAVNSVRLQYLWGHAD